MELTVTSEDTSRQSHKVVGLTLKEIASIFNSPVSEEDAWAVCYLVTNKLSEMQWPSKRAEISLDSVVITTDGTIELLYEKKNGLTEYVQSYPRMMIQSLGIMIYTLLDYGLPDDKERTLSQPLESLIETMTELNSPTSNDLEASCSGGSVTDSPTSSHTGDSGITTDNLPTVVWEEQLGRILKACELQAVEVADPLEHFRRVCRGMVEETISIRKLNKEAFDSTTSQSHSIAETWNSVMEGIKNGVQLRQVNKHVDTAGKNGVKVSNFDLFLMSIAKFDKNKLNNVELDHSGKPTCDHPRQSIASLSDESLFQVASKGRRRATVGDIHTTLMSEIKTRPALKPASERNLRPLSFLDCPLSPMESLLKEILTPPPLKKVERTSPKRLSLSLDSYRKCRSNPNLLDIPSPATPFGLPPAPLSFDCGTDWNQNISQSSSPIISGESFENLAHPSQVNANGFSGPFSSSSSPREDVTRSVPVGVAHSIKQHKVKKSRHSDIFQKKAKKLSSSSEEAESKQSRNANIRTRRSSCPTLLDESQPTIFTPRPTEYGNRRRGFQNISSTQPRPNDYTPDYGVSDFRVDQHRTCQRPTHLQLAPTPGQPAAVRISSSRNRIKSWTCFNNIPHERTTECNGGITKESRTHSWNAPEYHVYPPIECPPLTLSPSPTIPRSPRFTHSPLPCSPCLTFSPVPSPSRLTPSPYHSSTSNGTSPRQFRPHSLTPSPQHSDNESVSSPSGIFLQLPEFADPTCLSEVIRIRSTVTEAELYDLQLENNKTFKNVSEEKVCFNCQKTKFSFLNQSHKCYICKRHVCTKCGKKHSLRGSNSYPKLVSLFRDEVGSMKAVYLCRPCLQYMCPEAHQRSTKEQYDC